MMMKVLVSLVLASIASATNPVPTVCTTGVADILGTRKAYAVQVCNLAGGTCFINHPAIASTACSTHALEIASKTCKLYPIFEYADNGVRSGTSAVEHMSTEGDLGCSISRTSSGGAVSYKYSGACVSVQCSKGGSPVTYAGLAMSRTSGTSNGRTTGVTNTATQTFVVNTVGSISSAAKQLKNVFLYRTGDHIATTTTISSSGTGYAYNHGALPTSNGNSYGPISCPSTNNAMTSTAATTMLATNLRKCGSSAGKWVYYNAVNLLMDASLYTQYGPNDGSTSWLDLASTPFLDGKSGYKAGTAMDDHRAVRILTGSSSSAATQMTSQAIEPAVSFSGETAGTWRSYGVVFYCDDYTRADLTACRTQYQKVFYVADPDPDAEFGESHTSIGGGATTTTPTTTTTTAAGTASGAVHVPSVSAIGMFCVFVSIAF